MINLRKAWMGSVAAVGLALTLGPVSAQTFASFSYTGPGSVTYTNGVLSAVNVPIDFQFTTSGVLGVPSVVGYANQSATLSFTATATGNAGMVGSLDTQTFDLTSFSIMRNGGGNLLSGNLTPATLSGVDGSTVAGFGGSIPPNTTVLNYVSDYLNFPPVVNADLSWTLNVITPPVSLNGNNFRNFTADISGNFSYTPQATVPEPGSAALLTALGVTGSLFAVRRLRRRSPR